MYKIRFQIEKLKISTFVLILREDINLDRFFLPYKFR